MNILLVSPIPPPAGGISTWTKGYLNSYQAKKNKINIVNTAVTGNRVDNFTNKNIFDEINRTINILKEMKYKLSLNTPDVVHINTSCSKFGMIRDLACLNLIKNSKTKIVLHCHCDTSYMVKGIVAEKVFIKICNKADKILTLNHSSYNHIKGIVGKESTIIPNFIKDEVVNMKHINKISNEIKDILYVGHIVKTKGCYEIISVAKELPDKNFIMVGYLSNEIKSIDTPKNVKFIGEVSHDEVLKYMKECDLFLFPTHTEGFPNVVLEAMACGMPILTTNVGAIPDMIERKGGIIVEPKDINSIKTSINKLEERKVRLEMSQWNVKKVNSNYTINQVMDKIFEVYEKIIT